MVCDCLCGQVKFEIVGGVPNLYQCHCSLCRKQGGSTSNTATLVDRKNFRWISDHEKISSWVKDNGFRSDFCSKCGTPVPNPLAGAPYFWVPAGLLSDEVKSSIVAHLYVGSKATWDSISLPGKHYETMPDLAEVISLLQSNGHT